MDTQRTNGFVIGSDLVSKGQVVWKVRVRDPASPHDGKKLVVASVHGGLELARGLNVHFAIGTIDDASDKKVLRAVDVCLQTPEDHPTSHVNRSGGQL